jgi:hypothetical protein
MLIYTEAELLNLGITLSDAIHIEIGSQSFNLVFSFSVNMRSFANKFCQRQEEQGYICLLVETKEKVLVWQQEATTISNELYLEELDSPAPSSDLTGDLIRQMLTNSLSIEILMPELIDLCKASLAEYIGPMAQIVINDIIDSGYYCPAPEFINIVALQIPEKDAANEFRNKLLATL